jgi:hypothetical protein
MTESELLSLLRGAGYDVSKIQNKSSAEAERFRLLKEFSQFPLETQRQMIKYGRKWRRAMME